MRRVSFALICTRRTITTQLTRARAVDRDAGRRTVPNVFVARETIGGGSDVEALFQSGKLTEMLRVAGVLE